MENKQTLVIKLGTSLLTGGSKHIKQSQIVELVKQCAKQYKKGHRIIIVSSGAIASGREHLNYPKLQNTIVSNQLLAAVGQSKLIQLWEKLFSVYGIHIGQILLTRSDLKNRKRFLNARNVLIALLNKGIIPIINENDAVATDEIKVGDNDNLSAFTAILSNADNLLLLTDIEGLYDSNPHQNPNAKLISEVHNIDNKLRSKAGKSISGLGTGGMTTKLQAADIAIQAGINVTITSGYKPNVIDSVIKNIHVGTRFYGKKKPNETRNRWIFIAIAKGDVYIDNGAQIAILKKKCSLLPKGIKKIKGEFSRGSVIHIRNMNGKIIARGISRYNSDAIKNIAGCHSKQINQILGYQHGPVVVHRNHMIVS
ncbi:Glutamate 5-kinase [Candidatus Providencia siddallii]|uniref:Glutamate 5-kinase n=1 Tax=Candidatus Providencia siddallii TaxID=1715285 RepID=A0A0M6W729_9GAMM|nr:Glutamate 5-kinase [Candidatus Providencia siddallii]